MLTKFKQLITKSKFQSTLHSRILVTDFQRLTMRLSSFHCKISNRNYKIEYIIFIWWGTWVSESKRGFPNQSLVWFLRRDSIYWACPDLLIAIDWAESPVPNQFTVNLKKQIWAECIGIHFPHWGLLTIASQSSPLIHP